MFAMNFGNSYANDIGVACDIELTYPSAQVFAGTSPEMTYDLTYQYSGTKPHQLSEVSSSQGVPYAMSFSYNASGSISEITDMMGVDHSSYYWGQEQWLCGVENTQGIHHYVYDHAGERIMKSSITQTTVQLNDETINTVTTLEPYTLYVNPYYVVTSFSNADQRSKHYYMGTQRVATDIGVDYGMSPSPEQAERARGGDDAATAGEATQGLEADQSPFQSMGYEQDLERVLLGLSGEIGVEDLSEALAPIERFYPDLSAGVNSGEGIESELPLYIGTRIMYWYHPDYVSNVDMVTDRSGEAYELFLYNAWGESLHHWTSSSTNSWSSPYRFNSKELDSETGMHYYGARYHHPKLSVWMSVDPLAHQTLEAYQFTGNNPIMRIDPDGLTDFVNNETCEIVTVNDGMNQTINVMSEDWQTAVEFSRNEIGNNPSKGYNSFISNQGGVAVPTEKEGGWIQDKELFLGFMEFKAEEGSKEVAAWELQKQGSNDEDYYVQPWANNGETEHTTSPPPAKNIYGYEIGDVRRLWHTHPFINGYLTKGLSDTDWYQARNLGMPSRVIYPNGSVWELINAPKGSLIPKSLWEYYGYKVLNP